MKSGVQMNFLERRASADRALSQLVRMVREETETLSSREQRGLYQLESMLLEKSSTGLPAAHVWIGAAVAARWMAFWTIVLALVRGLVAGSRVEYRSALARARTRVQYLRVHGVPSRVRAARKWLRRLVQRAHFHWLLVASRRKAG